MSTVTIGDVTEKACTKCDEIKPLDAFGRRSAARNGRNSRCKECEATYKRQWNEANPDKLAEHRRRWNEANPARRAESVRRWKEANKERRAETYRKWVEANREHKAEYGRQWRESNGLEYSRQWRVANPDKVAEWQRRRRARKNGAEGSHTQAEWQILLEAHGGMCAYCGNAPATTRDHLDPISKGGSDYIENIVPACLSCNSSKRDRFLWEWDRWT